MAPQSPQGAAPLLQQGTSAIDGESSSFQEGANPTQLGAYERERPASSLGGCL